jgi:hypothetical protein
MWIFSQATFLNKLNVIDCIAPRTIPIDPPNKPVNRYIFAFVSSKDGKTDPSNGNQDFLKVLIFPIFFEILGK